MRGTRLSARVNDVVVGLKVLAILAVIIGAIPFIQPHLWVPFVPPNTGVTGSFGISGVMRAAGILFFAYVGFDSISTLGQETRNPQRTIPLALMISLAVCVLLYVGVSLGDDGDSRLPHAQRRRPDRRSDARAGTAPGLGALVRQRGRDLRPGVGAAGHPAGPGAHLLRDGAGRGCCRPPSPASIRNTARRILAPSSPGWAPRCSPACSRSTCWAT